MNGDQVRIRRLKSEETRLYRGPFGLLHCDIQGERTYRGIFAVRMFPVHHPNRYISLHYTNEKYKEVELGVIEDLKSLPEDQQLLIHESLDTQYYEQEIHRIHDIQCQHGLLFFEVETQRGREKFMMPWRGDRAEDYGEGGKVLLDALDNRYVIPNVSVLPLRDRRRFMGYIYW